MKRPCVQYGTFKSLIIKLYKIFGYSNNISSKNINIQLYINKKAVYKLHLRTYLVSTFASQRLVFKGKSEMYIF